jgi:hypothetical protein
MSGGATHTTREQLVAALRERLAVSATPAEHAPADAPADGEREGVGLEHRCAEALARVHGAADLLKFTVQRIDELEAWSREMSEASARQLEALQAEVLAAETRAAAEEDACRRTEDWLRRMHAAVVDRFERAEQS